MNENQNQEEEVQQENQNQDQEQKQQEVEEEEEKKQKQQTITKENTTTATSATATAASTANAPMNTTTQTKDDNHIFSSAAVTSSSEKTNFINASPTGEIPSFNGDEKAKATDFANYFCSYAQLYHQKQMLADHNRMAAYHAAILGNADVFEGKVVMDIGTGSGILAVWAAQAGARKVYAIEYTDMAKHAQAVMTANGVDNVVTVIQGAVEDIQLPIEDDELEVEQYTNDDDDDDGNNDSTRVVDIIISEWMGYFLLRESMLDSIIRARDKFLKKRTGLMLPSHVDMYIAPVNDEEERKTGANEYASAMSDWFDFCETTKHIYGVDMSVLESDFDREQKEYYLFSSRWTELPPEAVLAEPKMIKHLDLCTCSINDSRGIPPNDPTATFDFTINGNEYGGPISGLAGWFTADFRSRTDNLGIGSCSSTKASNSSTNTDGADGVAAADGAAVDAGGGGAGSSSSSCHPVPTAPKVRNPAFLSTGPENGFTHWGQQTFYFMSSIPLLKGQMTRLTGNIELMRTKENSRLYNCRICYNTSRLSLASNAIPQQQNEKENDTTTSTPTTNNDRNHHNGHRILMKSKMVEQLYQIP